MGWSLHGSGGPPNGIPMWEYRCRVTPAQAGVRRLRWPTASSHRTCGARRGTRCCFGRGWSARALLQGRPEPEHLVGHDEDVDGPGRDLVRGAEAAGRHPGADQEQAGTTRRTAPCSRGRARRTPAGGSTSSGPSTTVGPGTPPPRSMTAAIPAPSNPASCGIRAAGCQALGRTRNGRIFSTWSATTA